MVFWAFLRIVLCISNIMLQLVIFGEMDTKKPALLVRCGDLCTLNAQFVFQQMEVPDLHGF